MLRGFNRKARELERAQRRQDRAAEVSLRRDLATQDQMEWDRAAQDQMEWDRAEQDRAERERMNTLKMEQHRRDEEMGRSRNVTPDSLRELRELIRARYKLDVEIWSLRDVRNVDRPLVTARMERADAISREIHSIVDTWEGTEAYWTPAEWEQAMEVKRRLFVDGNRSWSDNPPWVDENPPVPRHNANDSMNTANNTAAEWEQVVGTRDQLTFDEERFWAGRNPWHNSAADDTSSVLVYKSNASVYTTVTTVDHM